MDATVACFQLQGTSPSSIRRSGDRRRVGLRRRGTPRASPAAGTRHHLHKNTLLEPDTVRKMRLS